MARQKSFRHFGKCIILKNYIYISIQTLYSVLCWSTFWQRLQPQVLGITLQAWHTCIWGVSPILLKLCQVGWESVTAQLFSGLSRDVRLRFKSGPLMDIQRLVPKPLLSCLCCVLRVVVLLESEPSPQSGVLRALEQVFIKVLYVLCSVHLSLDPDYSPSPWCWKQSCQYDAATTMHHRRDGSSFPPDVTLDIQAKEFNLGFIRPENLVSHGLRFFKCLLENSKRAVMCPLLRSGFRLATLQWPDLVERFRDGCPSGWLSHLHRGTLELCQSNYQVLSHVPDEGPSPLEEPWWFQTFSIQE